MFRSEIIAFTCLFAGSIISFAYDLCLDNLTWLNSIMRMVTGTKSGFPISYKGFFCLSFLVVNVEFSSTTLVLHELLELSLRIEGGKGEEEIESVLAFK